MNHLAQVLDPVWVGAVMAPEQAGLNRARTGSRWETVRDEIQQDLEKLEKEVATGTSAKCDTWGGITDCIDRQ